MVLVEGDPHPGALKGRMSFQSFNPSIDVSIVYQCPKLYLMTTAFYVSHWLLSHINALHDRNSMKKQLA